MVDFTNVLCPRVQKLYAVIFKTGVNGILMTILLRPVFWANRTKLRLLIVRPNISLITFDDLLVTIWY